MSVATADSDCSFSHLAINRIGSSERHHRLECSSEKIVVVCHGMGCSCIFSFGIASILIVGLSYGARNVLSYTRGMMQSFIAFQDSPTIPLRRSTAFACSKDS